MGSLKRKNLSLPASASAASSSSKRPSREDPSTATNGYTGRRNITPSSSSSAAEPLESPAAENLANGTAKPSEEEEEEGTLIPPPLHSSDTGKTPNEQQQKKGQNIVSNVKEEEEEGGGGGGGKQEEEEEEKKEEGILGPKGGSKGDTSDNDDDGNVKGSDSTSPRSDCANPKAAGPLIPNHAGWFSWYSVHPVEQRGLPEFFNSKSKLRTPALYMQYRNLLMRKYLESPEKLFTIDDVSAAISDQKEGHLEAAKRIFAFLDHWGLINSRALGNAEVDASTKSKGSVAEGTSSGQPQTSLISNLYRFDSPSATLSKIPSGFNKVIPTPAMTESSVVDLQGGVQDTSVEYHCNFCSADCSKKRFHCQKQADFDLCPDCYNKGKFSYGITNTDFILMEAVADVNDCGGWSDQETLLLLEALELFGDNFSEIAEHVGTKTKAQCILHFIRMPIEDPFLDGVEFSNSSSTQQSIDPTNDDKNLNPANQVDDATELTDEPDQKPVEDTTQALEKVAHTETLGDCDVEDKESSTTDALIAAAKAAGLVSSDKSLSFSECGNPVMALVGFLAALVSPDVAATSAHSALQVLSRQASALQLADENSFNLESEVDTCVHVDERQPEEVAQLESQPDTKSTADAASDKDAKTDEGDVPRDSLADLVKGSPLVKIKNAAATALAAAAVKAKVLADQEEWEILRLTAFVVDSQTKKIEAKLKLFKELDIALEKEHTMLERSKQRLLSENSQIAMTRSIQSMSPMQYPSPSAGLVGPRLPLPMARQSPGFMSPIPTGNFMGYGTNDPFRGLSAPQVRDVPGFNTTPIRSLPFNNSPQF